MGIAIHYQGSIDNYSDIDALIADTQFICKSLNWPFQVLDENRPSNKDKEPGEVNARLLRGISVTPPESETLFLTFLPNSALCSPAKLIYVGPQAIDTMIKVIHIKTHFAGKHVHIALLKLLKYLKQRYISNLVVDDHGMYWETEDEEILDSQFEKFNLALELVPGTLSGLKPTSAQSLHSIADRMEKILLNKNQIN